MAELWDSNCFETLPDAANVATIRCLEPLFGNLVRALMAFSGVALFVMFLIGGFNFLFAGGDPKKMEKAKKTLTGAVTGLVILVAAYLILRAIAEITGATNLLNFSITVF